MTSAQDKAYKFRHSNLIVGIVFTLVGCVSTPPKAINEFYNGKYVVRDLSSAYTPKETHELLFTELVK